MTGVFLLLLLMIDFKDKNDETKEYSFGDLFDLQAGIVEDKYSAITTDQQEKVEFVKINSFTEDGVLMMEHQSENPKEISRTKAKRKTAKDVQLKTVTESKVIQENDFLIYTRGKPRGFSGKKFLMDADKNYVATHHFIYLRPRVNVLDIDMTYLHLMLDLYTRKDLTENYERKINEKRWTQNMGNSISIKELKDLKITLLKDRFSQQKVVLEYELKQKEYQNSIKDLKDLENCMRSNNFDIDNETSV
ncbi:hypothetical protein Q73A0000_05005 [Kaistella flava (ex Peng et al. 2021)]|uniref:Type I restriction modification DNA specificity domain-containing protein n=1 Tax=Kaistella flava (ex Peng et al. 2021) TaxID=2038776 RepID=A0A7M2Y6Q7_9FLAO|nr:hypothetical protein [Kaistella flava (ex Peng et al. 2021)]QOW09770.1 hypothetical protein Q73A0000_05005 [Kaistella flava (ex Peng et al. 2021)]